MSVANADVRRARAFLYQRGIKSTVIPPRRFALAAQELDKSFAAVLALIMRLKGRQGEGQAPKAEDLARKQAA